MRKHQLRSWTRNFLIGTFALSSVASFADASSKIVGGEETTRGEFPFLVSLHAKKQGHFCGGSLIRDNLVLTAAHCLYGTYPLSEIEVKVGVHQQSDSTDVESMKILDHAIHPSYDSNTSDYDFALILLDKRSKYKPISLDAKDPEETLENSKKSLRATVAGWGVESEHNIDIPDTAMKLKVPLIKHDRCEKAYPQQITSQMMCAGFFKGAKDSCFGDSGGPLFRFTKKNSPPLLIGVVSWGQGCARKGFPGVYAKVSSVLDWVEETFP